MAIELDTRLPKDHIWIGRCKRGAKPQVGISITQILTVIGLQCLHVNIVLRTISSIKLIINSLLLNESIIVQEGCQSCQMVWVMKSITVILSIILNLLWTFSTKSMTPLWYKVICLSLLFYLISELGLKEKGMNLLLHMSKLKNSMVVISPE